LADRRLADKKIVTGKACMQIRLIKEFGGKNFWGWESSASNT
jgi:hypothetical protein